jgi:hypothetical protein
MGILPAYVYVDDIAYLLVTINQHNAVPKFTAGCRYITIYGNFLGVPFTEPCIVGMMEGTFQEQPKRGACWGSGKLTSKSF